MIARGRIPVSVSSSVVVLFQKDLTQNNHLHIRLFGALMIKQGESRSDEDDNK